MSSDKNIMWTNAALFLWGIFMGYVDSSIQINSYADCSVIWPFYMVKYRYWDSNPCDIVAYHDGVDVTFVMVIRIMHRISRSDLYSVELWQIKTEWAISIERHKEWTKPETMFISVALRFQYTRTGANRLEGIHYKGREIFRSCLIRWKWLFGQSVCIGFWVYS